MIDAAERVPAKRIIAVALFYPYFRQDRKHQGREPISARLIADLYKTAGADRMMNVNLYAPQEQGFSDSPVDHLFAMPILVEYVRLRIDLSNTMTVSPDTGRIRVAGKWPSKLGGCSLASVYKTRDTIRPNVAVANRVVGEIKEKDCILVDDTIDMAGTITEAAKVLTKAGAKKVTVVVMHGIPSAPATSRLSECDADEVVVTDTLPILADKRLPTLAILSVAPLLARAIREIFDDGLVISPFD